MVDINRYLMELNLIFILCFWTSSDIYLKDNLDHKSLIYNHPDNFLSLNHMLHCFYNHTEIDISIQISHQDSWHL